MLTPDYPQFAPAEPPADGITVSAWRGGLQPFANDAAARSILCDMEAERTLWVSAGSIRASSSTEQHWAHPLLVDMDAQCEVMLHMRAEAMPRAYLLSPRFQPHYADTLIHPHPRADHTISHDGRPLPGLCVFSAAELTFSEDTDFHTQFLDQLTQYVAKHLIWLRTRRLCRRVGCVTSVLHQPRPGETILEQAPVGHWIQLPSGPVWSVDYWSGYWPGRAARAITPAEHVRRIAPTQRCWCGLNRSYGECHRSSDMLLAN
jgi:hypothetical protein